MLDFHKNLKTTYEPANDYEPKYPPSAVVINSRSLYNKAKNLKLLLTELDLDVALISETWERVLPNLEMLIDSETYNVISRKRVGHPGGGVAILVKKTYNTLDPDLNPPQGIEVIWRILRVKVKNRTFHVGLSALYVPPRSRLMNETVEFMISSIHILNARYKDITFLIGGDINNLVLQPIIDSLENMKQVVETPTHRNRVLDIILTNMKENYYPPFVRDPLECDEDLPGEPSDHKIVIFLPKTVSNSQILPPRKLIKSRPITQSGINEFGRFLTVHNWYEILSTDDIDEKTRNFHKTIRSKYEEFFPEKTIFVSALDKPWMTPELKRINRKMKQEFWRNRKSPLWRTLKKRFLTVKKANCKRFYTRIFDEALNSSPSQWYSLVKKIALSLSK